MKLRHAGHGAIVVHDFDDDRRRIEPRESLRFIESGGAWLRYLPGVARRCEVAEAQSRVCRDLSRVVDGTSTVLVTREAIAAPDGLRAVGFNDIVVDGHGNAYVNSGNASSVSIANGVSSMPKIAWTSRATPRIESRSARFEVTSSSSSVAASRSDG